MQPQNPEREAVQMTRPFQGEFFQKISSLEPSEIVAAMTFAGIFSYAALAILYNDFYSSFGIHPEDIGIGTLQVLTHSSGMLLLWLVVATFLLATVIDTLDGAQRDIKILESGDKIKGIFKIFRKLRVRTIGPLLRWPTSVGLILTGLFIIGSVTGITYIFMYKLVTERVGQAELGQPVGPIELFPGFVLLDISAESARIAPRISGQPLKLPDLNTQEGLLFLGQNAENSFFYQLGNTIIVPSNSIVVEVGP